MYIFFSSWRKTNFLLSICAASIACPAVAASEPALAMREKYASMTEQLQLNQFKRPLVMDSVELTNQLKGDVYAIVDYPISAVSTGLNDPNHWCDVLILHINTKYCHAVKSPTGTTLNVNIGKKTPELLPDTQRIKFNYRVVEANAEYFEIKLNAQDGPMGTSDYRILLQAVSIPNSKKTFLHLTYSYAVGFSGRLAMNTYLATIGSGKVGFTKISKQDDGQSEYIGGVRGLIERNTMRYYLAIDAYLKNAHAHSTLQMEKRLQDWFSSTEQYSRQLHEVDRGDYVDMKRAEYLRQKIAY